MCWRQLTGAISRPRPRNGVSYDHAWLDPETGRAFCLITGPSKEAIIRVHEKAGHPAKELYELSIQTS
jgi:uncharacterized protein DUF4242